MRWPRSARKHGDAAVNLDLRDLAPATVAADGVGACVPALARGRVHSVFRRACNIQTCAGELLTLLASDLGNQPHGIRLAAPGASLSERLRPGQDTFLEGGRLCVPAAGFTADFSRAAIWNGTLDAASTMLCDAGDPNKISQALREMRAILCEHAPAQGIAILLKGFAGSLPALERALAARLMRILPALAHATRARESGAVVAAAAGLVGLGTGLTPSGDDFIVGYLAALRCQAGREAGIGALLRNTMVPLDRVIAHTHAISRQMLGDALDGRFAEHLIDVVCAIQGVGDIVTATWQALQSGHSSGADTLCGLLFGFSPELLLAPAQSLQRPERAGTGRYGREAGMTTMLTC